MSKSFAKHFQNMPKPRIQMFEPGGAGPHLAGWIFRSWGAWGPMGPWALGPMEPFEGGPYLSFYLFFAIYS